MKLEYNPLIQGLIDLKWMAKEATPLLSAKMYENERSVVGKLRAHGLTSQAIFEAALTANSTLEDPLPVADLAYFSPIVGFDFVGFATKKELLAQYSVPLIQLLDRLIVVTADPSNVQFFDTLALRYPGRIEYWLGDSDQIRAMIELLTIPEQNRVLPESVTADEALENALSEGEAVLDTDSLSTDIAILEAEQDLKTFDNDSHEINSEIEESEIDPRAEVLRDSALDLAEIESRLEEGEGEGGREDQEGSAVEDILPLSAREVITLPEDVVLELEADGINQIESMEEVDSLNSMGSALTTDDELKSGQENSVEILASVLAEIQQEDRGNHSSTEEVVVNDGVIDYLNFVLLDAITQKASDIHFEPYESSYRVRFRIDGILHKVYVVPEAYRETLASRLKVMAELDIAEKRLPQDGHITLCLEEEEVDARISVIPTLWGEKVVIRLLDNSEINYSLNKIGLTSAQKSVVQSAIERSQGLILVTGPTGSGKTVTLYACLNYLNDVSRNIATVEDPIEINLEGINQLQVHPKIGLTFAEALRAFLRQDPDVLMVGEIRDYETADITIKAAQTGHLVLSTLHTKSAVESLVRLKNMGIESYNIASTVDLVIAQRLVRELCHCKEEDIVDSAYLETLGFAPMQAASKFYRASSCSECHDGYRGRFAIFEVMPVSKRMSMLLLEGASAVEIAQQAEREGVKSLRDVGIEMVLAGRTSLEEILRVTTE